MVTFNDPVAKTTQHGNACTLDLHNKHPVAIIHDGADILNDPAGRCNYPIDAL